jgi:hypothetical protein
MRCSKEAGIERRLRTDLRRLGGVFPFEINVVATVLEQIRRIDRDELSTRQLGWAAATTVGGSALLLAGLISIWPNMTRSVQGLMVLAASLKVVILKLIGPLASLVAGVVRSLEGLLEATVRQLAPLGLVAVVAGTLVMIATITLVLVHDFRRPIRTCLGEDH